MPNWCENRLTISGPKKVIDEIAKTRLSLQTIRPCPQELRLSYSFAPSKLSDQNLAKHGYANACDWSLAHWGTKWDLGTTKIEMKDECLEATFDSAWAPPVEAMRYLYEKYKGAGAIRVRLEYFEQGAGFVGVAKGEQGKFTDERLDKFDASQFEAFVRKHDSKLAKDEIGYVRELEEEPNTEVAADSAAAPLLKTINQKEPQMNTPTIVPVTSTNNPTPTAMNATVTPTNKVTKKPVAKKAAAKKPVAKKPAAKKPVAKKATAKKPVAKKAAAKKPTAKKPVAKKPVAKKPVAKKPVAKKATAKKPTKKAVSKTATSAKKAGNSTKKVFFFSGKKPVKTKRPQSWGYSNVFLYGKKNRK